MRVQVFCWMKYLFFLLCFGQLCAQTAITPNPFTTADEIPTKGVRVEKTAVGLDLMAGSKEGLTVFANSSNDHIVVSVPGNANQKKSITIANMSGKIVLNTTKRSENTFLVDVSSLRAGMYFMEVRSGGKVFRRKFVR